MITGFVHLVASQVITRLLTFGLNLATARSLTPEAYGVAAVQFHLINTTILFISREGFRRACLRIDQGEAGATRRVLRIAALTVPLGGLLAAAVTVLLLHSVGSTSDAAYQIALIMQGLAAFLEICSEPLYILASTRLLFGLRVVVETAAMTGKGLLTLALIRRPSMNPAIAFSWAQIAYAGITLAGYAAYFFPQLLPQKRRRNSTPQQAAQQQQPAAETAAASDLAILRLSGTFTLQAVEKLVLAEGSKMAVAAFQSGYDQGVYGLVGSLGSIVVRTLFQPFEEAAFTAFSKEQGQRAASPAQLQRQARMLALLVRCILCVGLVAAAFGPAFSHLALLLLYSRRWADTEAPLALGLYSQYLVLLAANGILEAFVHSVADERQLHANNAWLVAFTAAHATLSILASKAGGAGALILADAANMLLRITYCLVFVRRRFAAAVPGFRLTQLLPSHQTAAALGVALLATSASRLALMPDTSYLMQLAKQHGISLLPAPLAAQVAVRPFAVRVAAHVGVGVACLGVVAATLVRHERSLVREVRQLRKGGKSS